MEYNHPKKEYISYSFLLLIPFLFMPTMAFRFCFTMTFFTLTLRFLFATTLVKIIAFTSISPKHQIIPKFFTILKMSTMTSISHKYASSLIECIIFYVWKYTMACLLIYFLHIISRVKRLHKNKKPSHDGFLFSKLFFCIKIFKSFSI